MRKSVLFLVLLILTVIGTSYYLLAVKQQSANPVLPESFPTDNSLNLASQPIVPLELNYAAWIPSWAGQAGLTSLKQNAQKLDQISPVWYEVKDDGSLIGKRPSNYKDILSVAKQSGLKIIPTIAMFDHELFFRLLTNEVSLKNHISTIEDTVIANNYDGIDLDYESTQLVNKQAYLDFVSVLGQKLHERNKLLIVTVIAKWTDDLIYTTLPETRQVQQWDIIARSADYVRIMAYDYTVSTSKNPGPIASLTWIHNVLDYAVQKIPRNKIILSVHLYSYEWWTNDLNADLEFLTDGGTPGGANKARSYTYEIVQQVIKGNKGTLSEVDGEMVFRYQKVNSTTKKMEKRVLVYIDQQGVKARTDLAKQYGIAGLCFWRLGGDYPLLS